MTTWSHRAYGSAPPMVFQSTIKQISRHLAHFALGASLFALGGCGSAMPIFSDLIPDHSPLYTSSVRSEAAALSPDLTAGDWNEASPALAEALGPDNKGTKVSWNSTSSSTRGAFRALGSAYVQNGDLCRPFEAEWQNSTRQGGIKQGIACRSAAGSWQIIDTDTASTKS